MREGPGKGMEGGRERMKEGVREGPGKGRRKCCRKTYMHLTLNVCYCSNRYVVEKIAEALKTQTVLVIF